MDPRLLRVSNDEAGPPTVPALPVAAVLAGMSIPALPEGASARGLLAFVQLDELDGSVGWSVRVTANLHDEEVLGLLVGYVEHLKQEAAASWDDSDPTRPQL